MSEWEPATDAEVAMRDALRTDDQESYFRILSRVDLLLPVSADALAGLAPLGWGTWSTGGRTHVLAFTSTAALQACLADYTGSARRVPYQELANTWPNLEWWLAVNPGLPIEGYLPAWFVAQLSRGDLRLPTRGPGREATPASAKMQDLQAAALAANAAATRQEEAALPGGPTTEAPSPVPATAAYPQYPASTSPVAAPSAYGQAASAAYGEGNTPYGQPLSESPFEAQPPAYGQQSAPSAPAAYGQAAGANPPYGQAPSAYGQPQGDATNTPPAYGQPASPAAPAFGQPASTAAPAFGQPASPAAPAYGQPASPAAPAYGQPASPAAPAYGQPASPAAPALDQPASPATPAYGQPGGLAASAPPAYGRPVSPATGGRPASAVPISAPPVNGPGTYGAQPAAKPSKAEPTGPGGLPIRSPGSVLPSGLPARTPASAGPATPPGPISAASAAPLVSPMAPPPAVPPAYQPPSIPTSSIPSSSIPASGIPASGIPASGIPASGPPSTPTLGGAFGALGSRRSAPPSDLQDPNAPLPVRSPGANTPPVPEHFVPSDPAESTFDPGWAQPTVATPAGGLPRRTATPPTEEAGGFAPAERGGFPQGPASPQAAAAQTSPAVQQGGLGEQPGSSNEPGRGFGTPLPRRQATSPSAGPPASMTSFPAFQTRSDAARAAETPAERPGPTPPVIPGSPGSDRPARPGGHPPLETRGAAPSYSPPPPVDPFVPANDVERELYEAAGGHSTDAFLSTLLLATVLVPVADHSRPGSAPGESGFAFRTEQMDGEAFLIVFTSKDRLDEHYAQPTRTVGVRFYELIRNWPDPAWSFAVNPNSPIGAKYPGPQVIALANWAAEAGLGNDPDAPVADEAVTPVPAPQPASDDAQHATVMQKTLPPDQVDYYLERGYDRVAGFVHRATEVEHLRTPAELFAALGLSYEGSQHQPDAKEAYVLRWPAYRPSLYRIPYGGQNEQALRAMDGWVIERAPFRGNGFAPGESRDVVAEFKVDSVRLPHGSQLWRIDVDGNERMVAIFDNDGPLWRRVGEQ
ncbi:SseB family protein [Paractinoplanes atraurantiacus]|uniref:SseB protein N-terminal domain-containing protein n=1 Tax=Paractinoplanes atraurantiacus TaxID=1036182 RepID=A0A285KHQ0_9ACTN|nr:SseB family protein [Actinoplanes atraurantiacus]SNY70946.1 SseB protein N-terminal domain-containing protein [Actinoplanes atraurantiacus]